MIAPSLIWLDIAINTPVTSTILSDRSKDFHIVNFIGKKNIDSHQKLVLLLLNIIGLI